MPGRLEGEHQQRRIRVGQRRDTTRLGQPLLGVQAVEAPDVEEEVVGIQPEGRQVRHVADHEGGAGGAPARRRSDRTGDVVDPGGLPAPQGEVIDVQASAATEVERPTERTQPLGLLPVQQRVKLAAAALPARSQGVTPKRYARAYPVPMSASRRSPLPVAGS